MSEIIINIFEKEVVNLRCTKCGNSKDIDVKTFSNIENRYFVKCKCGHSYKIMLERRKFLRKYADLRGSYTPDKLAREEFVDIIDLSAAGLCFVRRDNRDLAKGQIIDVSFVLENVGRDEIRCKAIIRQVKGNKVGVEFLELPPGMKTVLGFYLFNYVEKDSRVQEVNFPILPAN